MNWLSHAMPSPASGNLIKAPAGKHGSLEWCPLIGKMLHFGGDASGMTGTPPQPSNNDNNYRQEVWSLDATTGVWVLEQPYCMGEPGHRPHRPDWCAWVWDSKRNVFWFWPGESLMSPGTGGAFCNINEFDPWIPLPEPMWGAYGKWRPRMVQYDPANNTYLPTTVDLEPYVGSSARAWGAIYDAVDDQIVRVHFANGSSAPIAAQHLDCESHTWSVQMIKEPEYPLDVTQANIGRQRVFFDSVTRKLLAIDPNARHDGKAYLYSYDVAGRVFKRESVIPVPPMGPAAAPFSMDTQINFVGDSTLRRAWWVVIANNLAAERYGKKIVGGAYDGRWDETSYNARDILAVMECDLDTYAWRDIMPMEVEGASVKNPRPYCQDPKRLDTFAGGAHGITIGYDPLHRLLITMNGYASSNLYTLQVGEPDIGVPPVEEDLTFTVDDVSMRLVPDPEAPVESRVAIETPGVYRAELIPAVPVDCVCGEWSDWFPKPGPDGDWVDSGDGQQSRVEMRTRPIVTMPANGGAACGPTVEDRVVSQPCPSGFPSVAGTALRSLIHPTGGVTYPYNASKQEQVIGAWNGAAFDYETGTFYLAVPGGHNDWFWNESFSIKVPGGPSMRLHDASNCPPVVMPPGMPSADQVYTDGKPASRHTYHGNVWLPVQKKVMLMSGSTTNGGQPDRYVGWLDPVTGGPWEHKARMPYYRAGLVSAYHFGQNKLIHAQSTSGMHCYDPATDKHTKIPQDNADPLNADTGSNITFCCVGDFVYSVKINGHAAAGVNYALARFPLWQTAAKRWELLTPTGDTAALKSRSPGMELDQDNNALVFFSVSDTTHITICDLDTLACTRLEIPEVDVRWTTTGIYGRFRRYAPGVYALLAGIDGATIIDTNTGTVYQ